MSRCYKIDRKTAETDISVAYRKAFKTFINVRRKNFNSEIVAFIGIFRNFERMDNTYRC